MAMILYTENSTGWKLGIDGMPFEIFTILTAFLQKDAIVKTVLDPGRHTLWFLTHFFADLLDDSKRMTVGWDTRFTGNGARHVLVAPFRVAVRK